ncbi:MAG: hypothetical protein QXJ97_10210 [Desulfurococcaceae archaeon]
MRREDTPREAGTILLAPLGPHVLIRAFLAYAHTSLDAVEACKSIELLTIAVPRLYPLYICSSYTY